jgi:hypothetical protein
MGPLVTEIPPILNTPPKSNTKINISKTALYNYQIIRPKVKQSRSIPIYIQQDATLHC